jgi:hypothetical protein
MNHRRYTAPVLGALAVALVSHEVRGLSNTGPEQQISLPVIETTMQPRVAWIKNLNTMGRMLVAFSSKDSAQSAPTKPSWTSNGGWFTSNPTWPNSHKWDDPGFQWPDPVNFCALWECPIDVWTSYDHVGEAVWTGLNNVAALVVVGGVNGFTNQELAVVTSIDGGDTFTTASIVSTLAADLTIPAGDIDPDSVQASLQYSVHRMNDKAGTVALPVYIVWFNRTFGSSQGWWMTKVIVGTDGSIAQIMAPTKITAIAPDTSARVSIMGVVLNDGTEQIQLAWSEHVTPLPQCPSTATTQVRWWNTFSNDLGTTWTCTESVGMCKGGNALVDEDKAWRPCVGASHGPAGSPAWGVNNSRPEFVINRGEPNVAPWMWYMAFSKTIAGKSHIVVKRDTLEKGYDTWHTIYTSPSVKPVPTTPAGAPLGDAWGQAMTIHQGTFAAPGTLAVTWRTADPTTAAITMNVATHPNFGGLGPFLFGDLASTSWPMTDALGLYEGVAVQQVCVIGHCPPGTPPSRVGFLAAWPDNRSPAIISEVWARKFQH